MNQADKEAFEKDWKSKNDEFNFHGAIHEGKWYYVSIIEQRAFEQWNAALIHARSGEAVFWYRPRSDGGYEGPIHSDSIEAVRKESGAWLPLFTHSQVAEKHHELVSVPDGYALVPLKITDDMRQAWIDAPDMQNWEEEMSISYEAMLAAAPSPAVAQGDVNKELLDALKSACEHHCDDYELLWLSKAREAINKAEGQS